MDKADLHKQAQLAQQVLDAEADAISRITLGPGFHQAVDLILQQTGTQTGAQTVKPLGGSLVVTGLGKSGLIGQKLSATFTSTGTPSHFLHPTEAMHGDLGRVRQEDVVLALSFTGNTDELVGLATILRQDDVPVIAVVGNAACDLARLAACTLEIGDVTEACPLNLAPTASTTAMLALGDALALVVAQRRSFGVDDFKRFHPGGGLGRQLMPVTEAMRFKVGDNLPLIARDATLRQAYEHARQLAQTTGLRRAGALLVVDDAGKLAGIFTDGDLRRLVFEHTAHDLLDQPIARFMTQHPRTLGADALVRDAVQTVRELRIDEIPVVDEHDKPVGLIDVQDLLALKVIQGNAPAGH